jgi:hypothetical protein
LEVDEENTTAAAHRPFSPSKQLFFLNAGTDAPHSYVKTRLLPII